MGILETIGFRRKSYVAFFTLQFFFVILFAFVINIILFQIFFLIGYLPNLHFINLMAIVAQACWPQIIFFILVVLSCLLYYSSDDPLMMMKDK